MTKLSVIVVNYNSGPCLASCLDTVLGDANVTEVVVVDNASADDSMRAAQARMQNSPERLQWVQLETNTGFARAANRGVEHTHGGLLLFLNPDAQLQAGALQNALSSLHCTRGVGLVGAWVVDAQGHEQRGTRRRLPTLMNASVTFLGLGFLERWWPKCQSINLGWQAVPTDNQVVEAVSGAFMLMPRKAFVEIGGFDPGYFLHCEDLDLFWRLRQAGYAIVLAVHAKVTHEQGVPSRSVPLRVHFHKHRSMARFFLRHDMARGRRLVTLILLGLLWLRYCLALPWVVVRALVNR